MLGYALGITLYFVGIGLWVIALVWLVAWGFVLLIPAIPALLLAFIGGYFTNILQQREEWPTLRTLSVWAYLRQFYFRFSVHGNEEGVKLIEEHAYREEQQNAGVKYVWAIYPHGHYSLTALFYWALNPNFTSTRPAVHSALFFLPGIGSVMGWLGAVGVSRAEMTRSLNDGQSLVMCPGGVADIANTGNEVKRRSGFVRIAQDTGACVVPVWCPDERSYYRHWLPLGRLTEALFSFPVPLFIFGRWWCPLLPRATPQSRIYVGKPVDCREGSFEDNLAEYWACIAQLQEQAGVQHNTSNVKKE